MLSAADGELPAHRGRQVKAHLEACWACRTRLSQLERAIANFTTSYSSALDQTLPGDDVVPTARLRTLLAEQGSSSQHAASVWKWAACACLVACLSFFAVATAKRNRFFHASTQEMASQLETEVVPNPQLTPGEITMVSKSQVCQGAVQSDQRRIPEALRQAVLAEYGVKNVPQEAYEVDFLITPELGGSASIRNLWPQPYFSRTWNARVKDALEDRLHKLVCNGDLDLSTAQREIATNWVDAYKKYVRTEDPM